MTLHHCNTPLRVSVATEEKPYHYVDSGLPNVYLVGVKYWECDECKKQAAEIPAVEQLMNVIAKAIVMKEGMLVGDEIRFLRKRVGKKQADFADLINNTPEHLSKLENGQLPLQEATDKLIRLTYGMLSKDEELLLRIMRHAEEWLKSITGKGDAPIRIKKAGTKDWAELDKVA
jgi:putative zinc finger/helix-turn-helix YgiT family protein